VMIEGEDVPQGNKAEPITIPRTTIVIQQNRPIEPPPKEFARRSNSNAIWIALIVLLLLVIGGMLYLFFTGSSVSTQ